MTDEVIVQVFDPRDVDYEDAERLVAALQDEGLEAWRWRTEKQEGFGPLSWYEVLLIWLAAEMGRAVIEQVVAIVVEWMREQFRREPHGRPKHVLIYLYEGDEGEVKAYEVVELESADAEPVRRPPKDEFEQITRTKPHKI